VIVEPPPFRKPHPAVWMGAGSDRSIRDVAKRGFNLLLGQYASPEDVAHNIAVFREAVEAAGQRWYPMRVGVTRAFFVSESEREREEALERRLANRTRQLKLVTTPDGTVLGGPDRAGGDPIEVNLKCDLWHARSDRAAVAGFANRRCGICADQRWRIGWW
jgi:alkanesulfonate monooxygenase SsuD/methylene tetrahydromethanopterin reductase-like flavin-dependent oxidoreductase (luciferase family)